MIGCGEWKEQLLDFALNASAARGLEEHLRACSACAAAMVELRARQEQVDAGLRQLVQGAEPSIEFRARVLAAVETQPRHVGLWPAWAGALAAVAALVLFAVLVGLLGPQSDPALMTAQELSRWQSPTETLLRSPAEELLQSAPPLGQFYFSLEPISPEMGDKNGGNDES
jgi:anti-sigma factor RsiW